MYPSGEAPLAGFNGRESVQSAQMIFPLSASVGERASDEAYSSVLTGS